MKLDSTLINSVPCFYLFLGTEIRAKCIDAPQYDYAKLNPLSEMKM